MTPLVVDKEEEGEDGDDEAGYDKDHHHQAAVHHAAAELHPGAAQVHDWRTVKVSILSQRTKI